MEGRGNEGVWGFGYWGGDGDDGAKGRSEEERGEIPRFSLPCLLLACFPRIWARNASGDGEVIFYRRLRRLTIGTQSTPTCIPHVLSLAPALGIEIISRAAGSCILCCIQYNSVTVLRPYSTRTRIQGGPPLNACTPPPSLPHTKAPRPTRTGERGVQQHAGGAVTSPLSAPLDWHGAATPRIRRATGAILETLAPSPNLSAPFPTLLRTLSAAWLPLPYEPYVRTYVRYVHSYRCSMFSQPPRSRSVRVSAFGSPKPTSSVSGWVHLQRGRHPRWRDGRSCRDGAVVAVVVVKVVVVVAVS